MFILYCSLILMVFRMNGALNCPDGYFPHDTSCYLFSHNEATFTDAYVFCQIDGAHLVEIDNDRENSFMAGHARLRSADSWLIGLTDNEVEGEWHWIKSKTYLNGHYAKWAPGEPNDQHVENCAYLAASGPDWYDVSCDGKYHYICELNSTIPQEPLPVG